MNQSELANLAVVTAGIISLTLFHFSLNTSLAYAHSSTPSIQEDSLVVAGSPSSVSKDGTVTITATVLAHRTGGTANTNWSIQLTLPSGYTLSSGVNPQSKSTGSHGSAMASWTVTAPSIPSGPDTFTVTATAIDASTSSALSGSPEIDTFAITTVNRVPTANDDAITIPEDTPFVVISALVNDTDSDNDTLLISSIASAPSNGTAQITDSNTTITYSPNANFFGIDSFSYTIQDGYGDSSTGTVTIVVISVNDAPMVENDSYSTDEDTVLIAHSAGGVLANDTAVEDDKLSAVLIDGVSQGVLTLYSNGSFVYTPEPNFYGIDSFTYIASDGELDSGSIATVNITVSAINDIPIAYNSTVVLDEDEEIMIDIVGYDADVDLLTFAVFSMPAHGTITGFNASSGEVVYNPASNYDGQDNFQFLVNDGTVNSTVATVSITVNPVEEADGNGNNNRRDKDEEEVASQRVTYEDTYFDDKPTKKVQIQSGTIINSDGASFSSVSKGEKVTLSYSLRNYQQKSQEYCFIVQVQDEEGLTVAIQYSKGELGKGEKAKIEQNWEAEGSGEYTVKVFIWDQLDSPTPLSDMDIFSVNVR